MNDKKLVFITGATSGIGLACAEKFASKGYDLILTGRRECRLNEIQSRLTDNFCINVKSIKFDVSKLEEVEAAFANLKPEETAIDLLINNAGLARELQAIQEGSISDWSEMIDTNVKGLLYVTRIVSKQMAERGSGHIINVGSLAGKECYPNGAVYCATKHAVDALTKAMRMDLVKYGVKVSAIHPGLAETEFSLVRFHGDSDKAKKVYEGIQPLSGEDIAESVFFIASAPNHVNIADLVILPSAQASSTIVNRVL